MRLRTLICLMLAGCGSSGDPCAGRDGACVSLTVASTSISELDTLLLIASGAVTGTRESAAGQALPLPITVALTMDGAPSGALHLEVDGKLGGAVLGHGAGDVSLVEGRGALTIQVEAAAGGGDLAGDLRDDAGGADAATDMSKPILPTLPVVPGDLDPTGLSQVTLPAGDVLINTDTGEIKSGANIVRAANTVFTNPEIIGGIGYHQSTGGGVIKVGVFSFADLTIAEGTTVKLHGAGGAALVAARVLVLDGVIEARPMDSLGNICPLMFGSAGGFLGGTGSAAGPPFPPGGNGGGPGAGIGGSTRTNGTSPAGGGGGGSHGSTGGRGADGVMPPVTVGGGPAGAAYGVATLQSYAGGSGGGGGGGQSPHAYGGAGGGAVHLVAGTAVTVGTGGAKGGVNAGACGGRYGSTSGGGGGAGGAILIESPAVQLGIRAVLAANGGGGGGLDGGNPIDGANATFDDEIAYGGGSSKLGGVTGGGNGGAGANGAGTSSSASSVGGGGAAGRIRINSTGGANINAGAILSPNASTTLTTFGPLATQ